MFPFSVTEGGIRDQGMYDLFLLSVKGHHPLFYSKLRMKRAPPPFTCNTLPTLASRNRGRPPPPYNDMDNGRYLLHAAVRPSPTPTRNRKRTLQGKGVFSASFANAVPFFSRLDSWDV